MKPHLKNILILLGVALLARGLLFAVLVRNPGRMERPDSITYLEPALQLLENHGQYPAESAWRTPIYPLFIALVYALLGKDPLLILLAQMVVDSGSILLVYSLGLQLFEHKTAFLAALLAGISVEMITQSMMLLTETLFTFLFLGSTLTMVLFRTQRKSVWLVFSALLLGLSILCRPVALYYPLLACVLLLAFNQGEWTRRVFQAVLFGLLVLLTITPWLIHTMRSLGAPVLSTIASYNLLYYNATALEANLKGVNEAEVRSEMDGRVNQFIQDAGWTDSELSRSRAENVLAWEIIRSHPFRYLGLHLKGDLNGLLPNVTDLTELLGVTVGGKGTASVLNQYGLWAAIQHYFGNDIWLLWVLAPLILLLGFIYVQDLVGCLALIRERNRFTVLVLLLPVVYFLGLPGAPSMPRFRVPVAPYLYLLAAHGVVISWTYLSTKRKAFLKSIKMDN